ncbi:RNA-binding transcriptional accessory protein [Fructilactobacillus hinvesii]|uniref:RNA-binding transcriptional accessory protein n=1 Tax=Fructilactobacillus hinvesii TaxID=2940300 RepID=A0ABY5BT75_9LACO|nr:Tex family protein [Fructilactobacillus hinvesii]USS87860.1 RNA-binding transcriptional accessory protein [Fructilactobacillus hinvesii]
MGNTLVKQVVATLDHLNLGQAQRTLQLLEAGNTVPFIARYRKEQTGNLDEVQIRDLADRYQRAAKLAHRKQEIQTQLENNQQLTPALQRQLAKATTMQQVEDLYLPYKPKRQTKAELAKQGGLQPLANQLLQFPQQDVAALAAPFVNPEQAVPDVSAAVQGAQAIISQAVAETARFREWLRNYTWQHGQLVTTVKPYGKEQDERQVYSNYYQFTEPLTQVPAYRVLAIDRGEQEEVLRVKIDLAEEPLINYLRFHVVGQHTGPSVAVVETALTDAYRRFLRPAIDRELRKRLTEQAATHAIQVFGTNLYHLLMQPPLKGKVVLGFDPAYRTGCKLAVVDERGKFLAKQIIYATPPASEAQIEQARVELKQLLDRYHVDVIAIGNGTASRESEQFVAETLRTISRSVHYVIVNEAGASVYSASTLARAEFPELHVEERSAISIARRLQDPLAELIKIDPKAVGVGQYQHDVSEKELDHQLDQVVETAVNQVGVNLNTASPQLLAHISGLTPAVAENVVAYREANGGYRNRNQLKQVQRLGPKAFEQSVGFLRIIGGSNPFDNTDIHPESYPAAQAILDDLRIDRDHFTDPKNQTRLQRSSAADLAQRLSLAPILVSDLLQWLTHPGRDLRDQMPAPLLKADVLTIQDLRVGMELQGTVRNVTDFGAFVDIGVKQDGLVHISRMKKAFVKDPAAVVAIGDVVTVWVIGIDEQRQRIQLSMIEPEKEN